MAPRVVTPNALPPGFGPGGIRGAYNLTSKTAGAGRTVAIVDAFDDPNAESDLAVYRSTYGLPACTTANHCFRKVGEAGTSVLPAANADWAIEISLDLDMVSATCPVCHILLVEANSTTLNDLGTGVNTAVRLGAKFVSNSYGAPETKGEATKYNHFYNHQGVAVTAAAGDSGYGVDFPASSRYVTAVGGTSLRRAKNKRGWSERAWAGTGSGCSRYSGKPGWQPKKSGCPTHRTVGDVSAVADPNTGVALYDTFPDPGVGLNIGWNVAGGTSASSPIIAAVYARAGNPAKNTYPAHYPYKHVSHLWDVIGGHNGTCSHAYLCNAVKGYDGPTGLGTPHTAAGFKY
jgi:subtilase family serine protease